VGADQSEKYLADIEACGRMLANRPTLGRACGHIKPDLRQFETGRHVIYYRPDADEIVVSRVLHDAMIATGRMFDED
jgi:toxin ParE1/3/4